MIKKNKNILVHSSVDDSYPDIQPAKNFIPDWFKNTTKFKDGMNHPNRFPIDHTFKMCSVFADTFISGYMIPLSVDLLVEKSGMGPIFSWSNPGETYVVTRDPDNNKNLPIPNGYSKIQFAWHIKHMIKIPKGYSALITHPFNRFDLPFITLGGIVDGEFVMPNGHIPFMINESFEGLIPAETPIAQILLFKRENWESKKDNNIIVEGNINIKRSNNSAFGWYKKNFWQKKKYD